MKRLLMMTAGLVLAAAVVRAQTTPPTPDLSALPQGPGRDILVRDCSGCHSPLNVTAERHDADGWDAVIGQMIDRGAAVDDADETAIRSYLATAFGPPVAKPAASSP